MIEDYFPVVYKIEKASTDSSFKLEIRAKDEKILNEVLCEFLGGLKDE